MKSQSPARIQWEDIVLQVIVKSGLCRSDAQSLVETGKGEALLDALYQAGTTPTVAAQKLLA